MTKIQRMICSLLKVLSDPFLFLLKHRHILYITSIKDLRARFAGSSLGSVWLILSPLLLLMAYSAIYIYIFKVRIESMSPLEYVVFIFSGLVPYLGFADALAAGTPSILVHMNLVRNILMPVELIPVKSVITAQVGQFVGFSLLFIFLIMIFKLSIWTPFFLLLWFLQILFLIGLSWILSSLNVYFRDIQQIVPFVLLILLMLSPISYSETQAAQSIRPFLELNPLYPMIVCYHHVLIYGTAPPVKIFSVFICQSLSLFILGYAFMQKMKLLLVDHA